MKAKLRKVFIVTLAAIVLLGIAAAVVIPRLIDPDSFRGLLRTNLQSQLGRDVDFGKMQLSLWPVLGLRLDDLVVGRTPTERFERPIVAESLRVGARLMPLLRGRLEVTSLTVEQPQLILYRRADGSWEPTPAPESTGEPAEPKEQASKSNSLVVDKLRVTGGRVEVRYEEAGALRDATLDDLTLELAGVGGTEPIAYELAARLDASAGLRVAGALDPGDTDAGRPLRFDGRIEADGLLPSTLRDWLAAVAPDSPFPEGLLVERPFSSGATIEYTATQPAQLAVTDLKIASASIGVRVKSASGNDSVVDLSEVDLSLDRLPDSGPAALTLSAQVGPQAKGKLELRGTLGPLGESAATMPLDLTLKGPAALAGLGALLPTTTNLDLGQATATADLQVSGTFGQQLAIKGGLSFAGAKVTLVTPEGSSRTLPFALQARGNLAAIDSLKRIQLADLDLEFPGEGAHRKLTLRGSVNMATDPARVDLTLLPTRVAADDLAALAALFVSDGSISFGSPDPVQLELRARGPLGGDTLPELEGRATLSGFTLRVAGMKQPMEKVGAEVTFAGNRVVLEKLGGAIGKSDVTASRVTITDFASPRVQLELNSSNADFWELFSFIESSEAADENPATAAADDPLSRLTVEGQLRIDRGTLQTLEFEKLSTKLDYRDGLLTLDALTMNLNGGKFTGKLVQDQATGLLKVDGQGADIDANAFLEQNLDLGGLLTGRSSTELALEIGATESADPLAGISGGGPLRIVDGQLAKLDVMKALSKVTGVFGESSLRRLSRQLATEGTPFTRAETRLQIDGGTMNFEELLFETADLTLAGRASLESATGKMKGRFVASISPELSATMRDEESRAAKIFWDQKTQRVSFGFTVDGPAESPSVSVDWDRAIRGAVGNEVETKLRGLLDKKLGVKESVPAPSPAPPPAAEAPPPAAANDATTTESPASLHAEITNTRWKGPVLLRDLSVEGVVRGARIDHVSFTVIDAEGKKVDTIQRLPDIDSQLSALSDPEGEASLTWRADIDGKRLLPAKFPVTVTVTVHDRDGKSVSARRDVRR